MLQKIIHTIHNPILYVISWYFLERMNDQSLNCLYVDTLAREQVLQQKIEPDRSYTLTADYRLWYLRTSQFESIENWKRQQESPNPLFVLYPISSICNDDLCKMTGINYYGLVKQYEKNILIVDYDNFYS